MSDRNRSGNRRGLHPNSRRALVPGAGAFAPGSTPANLKGGLRSRRPSQEIMDPVLDAVIEDLEARVPIRDEDGDVPPWLREACWSAGVKKLQVTRCARYIAQHGETDERGRWRPENDGLVKATEGYERSLERLAMTVGAHARAGLDLRRAEHFDLARHWQEEDGSDG